MSKQPTIIESITINIAGHKIQITQKEAKKLKEALDEVFPAQVAPVQIQWHHEPFVLPDVKYPPHWQFGADTGTGGGSGTCKASLTIEAEGNIII